MGIGFIPTNFDSDGDPLQKNKVTKVGNTYQRRAMVFTTSLSGSIENHHYDGTSFGDATLAFFDDSNNSVADSLASVTVFDWEPPYNYDLIDGQLLMISLRKIVAGMPVQDNETTYENNARMWCVAAPLVPASFGGSVELITNEIIPFQRILTADGRGAKEFVYDPTFHTNLIRTYIKHDVGQLIQIKMVFNHFWDRLA